MMYFIYVYANDVYMYFIYVKFYNVLVLSSFVTDAINSSDRICIPPFISSPSVTLKQ